MANSIIRTEKLSKTFISKTRRGLLKVDRREVKALDSVDLEIEEGELFGLLGPREDST